MFETADIFSVVGSKQKAFATLEKGLKLSLANNDFYQACKFLDSLVLNSLYSNDVSTATDYLEQMAKYDPNHQFLPEYTLGKAIISAYQNQPEVSEKLFAQLDKMKSYSSFILPRWETTIAERNMDWQRMIDLNRELLELTAKKIFVMHCPPFI